MAETDKDKVVRRLTSKNFGRYIFPLKLSGMGHTPEEAWENAVEGFYDEPGEFPEDYDFEEEDEADW